MLARSLKSIIGEGSWRSDAVVTREERWSGSTAGWGSGHGGPRLKLCPPRAAESGAAG